MSLVQCSHCHRVYNLCDGEPIARYADCDLFKAPCCGRTVDTRSWKSLPDYRQLDRAELRAVRRAKAAGLKEAQIVFEDGSFETFPL